MRRALMTAGGGLLGSHVPPSPPAPFLTKVGVYRGGNVPDISGRLTAFATWLGAPVGYWLEFAGATTWTDFRGIVADIPFWDVVTALNPAIRPVLAIGLCTTDTFGQLANAAAGAFDSHHRYVADHLIAAGYGNIKIRLGHEPNIVQYPWAADAASAAAYVAAFNHVSHVWRTRPGANFTIIFNPTNGTNVVSYNTLEPASVAYDEYGLDIYNKNFNGPAQVSPELRWFGNGQGITDMGNGITAWLVRVALAGKIASIPEWATGPTGGVGGPGVSNGGDDAYFVYQMWKLIAAAANGIAWHGYWDHSFAFDGEISNDSKPNAGGRYRLSFGVPPVVQKEFIASAAASAINGANPSVPLPPLNTGDLVVVFGCHVDRAAGISLVTAGYTVDSSPTGGAAGTFLGIVAHKFMGAIPDTTVVGTGTGNANDTMALIAFVFRNVNATTPIDVLAVTVPPTSGVDPDPPSVTTLNAGDIVIAFAGSSVLDTTITIPAGYSDLTRAGQTDTNSAQVAGAWKRAGAAGAEDPAAFGTWTTSAWVCATVALKS